MGTTLSIETAQFIDRNRKSKNVRYSPPSPNNLLTPNQTSNSQADTNTVENKDIDYKKIANKKRRFKKTEYNNVSTIDSE